MEMWKQFAKKVKGCGFKGQVFFNDEGGVSRLVISVPLSLIEEVIFSRDVWKWVVRLNNGCKLIYDGEDRSLSVNDFVMHNTPSILTIEEGMLTIEVFNPER